MPDKPHINDFKRTPLFGQPMAWYVTVVDHEGTRFDLKFPLEEKHKAMNCLIQSMNAGQEASFVSIAKRLA